jgi:hypothetical protein
MQDVLKLKKNNSGSKRLNVFNPDNKNLAYAPNKKKTDVWLTVNRNSVWIRKTN